MFENGGNVWKHTVKTDFISRVKRLLESTASWVIEDSIEVSGVGFKWRFGGSPLQGYLNMFMFHKSNLTNYHVSSNMICQLFFLCPSWRPTGSESLNPKLCERWSFRSDDFQVQRVVPMEDMTFFSIMSRAWIFKMGNLQVSINQCHGVMNHDVLWYSSILAYDLFLNGDAAVCYFDTLIWSYIGYSCSTDTQHYMNTTVRL